MRVILKMIVIYSALRWLIRPTWTFLRDYGAYKNILRMQGQGTGENTLALGVSLLC